MTIKVHWLARTGCQNWGAEKLLDLAKEAGSVEEAREKIISAADGFRFHTFRDSKGRFVSARSMFKKVVSNPTTFEVIE